MGSERSEFVKRWNGLHQEVVEIELKGAARRTLLSSIGFQLDEYGNIVWTEGDLDRILGAYRNTSNQKETSHEENVG